MLRLDGEAFCTGRSSFLDSPTLSVELASKLFVRVRIGGIETLAQLDTGAAWSFVTPMVADALGLFDAGGSPTRIHTRLGLVSGTLERVEVTLVASSGRSLAVDATVFVSRDWAGGTFIGWNGLLERVRFAIDPRESSFYFGAG